ncbi:Strictosidine synthase 1 [Apostasia shenzhenica]|uniref:Strictosidine synthase 1 n=1 Tax=Apostasia shenzhenica TaxID=1088818 RepID=A0A2H9ZWW3_9ASPA|nr:Strictosidine synthase 1 [Apostasia shenzhenica]
MDIPDASRRHRRRGFRLSFGLLLLALSPVPLALFIAGRSDFDPAPFPADFLQPSPAAETEHGAMLATGELVGEGKLPGPEDLAYDEEEGYLYTGCADGWIRRVLLAGEAAVEDWADVGGRPLGVALSPDGGLVVAESEKGLLKVSKERKITLLTDEADGQKFKLTDGVHVASDGTIFFTDASYKYDLESHFLDFLEGRPHGRLLSYNPVTNHTTVLARDLYFANGISVAPDQNSLIFCETPLRRCRRYHIRGEKNGTIEEFMENLPGFPDNIRYIRDNNYLIALCTERNLLWDLLMKYPLLRKLKFLLGSHLANIPPMRNSGLMRVSLDGKPMAIFSDPHLSLVTSGLQIGKHLYFGSLHENHILRVDLTKLENVANK